MRRLRGVSDLICDVAVGLSDPGFVLVFNSYIPHLFSGLRDDRDFRLYNNGGNSRLSLLQ
jgi:hypothetical protein